jgi:hypothetical protein
MSTAVTKAAPIASALTPLATSMMAEANSGTSDFTVADIALPFLKLAQSLSPELQKSDPKYLKGLEVGDFFNSLTFEIFKGPIEVVRVFSEKKWLEWRPNNGGLAAVHDSLQAADRNRVPVVPVPEGKKDNEVNTEIIETAQIYMLVFTANDGWRPVVTGWTKSKLSVYRKWNGLIQEQTFKKHRLGDSPALIPVYGCRYKLTSTTKKNPKNQTYYVPALDTDVAVIEDAELFEMARTFREAIIGGRVKPTYAADDEVAEVPSDGDVAF